MAKDPQVIDIPLDKLTTSKFNVRRELGDISELVDSIKAVGVLQPILVRPVGKDRYEVIVGSRRFAAAQKAKLKTIPAIVKEMRDDEAIIESLVENIQRGDLEIEEIAKAYSAINELDPKTWTQEVFAKKIGKAQQWVSQIITAYNSVVKLRQMGKPYRVGVRPSREEREKGILPYRVLVEVEYALKAEEIRKVFPENKMDDVRVMLVEAVKDLDYDDAKRVIDYFKMYPEKPIEEVRDMALARKAGVELKTFVPARVMRKVEETAEKIGKPVEVIIPTVLERGVEEEAKKVEVERLLEKAPPYIVEVARKMESTMTPFVIQKIMELPKDKQEETVRYIEALRLSEEEAIEYIRSMKTEAPLIPEEEIEEIKKRYEEIQKRISEIAKLPEVQRRGELFRNWHSHYVIFQGLQEAFCPNCGKEKSGKLVWSCCGLQADEALKLAGDKFEKSQKKS